jgi:hypothetical protein
MPKLAGVENFKLTPEAREWAKQVAKVQKMRRALGKDAFKIYYRANPAAVRRARNQIKQLMTIEKALEEFKPENLIDELDFQRETTSERL